MPISCSLADNQSKSNNASSYTFTGAALGAEAADRFIIVLINYYATTAGYKAVSSVSVAGNSATIVAQASRTGSWPSGSAIAIVAVPTGTTGDLVVTLAGTVDNCSIGVLNVTGLQGGTPTDTDAQQGTSSAACALDVVAGGLIVGGASANGGASNIVWTNLTEQYDVSVESLTRAGGAFDIFGSAVANQAISVSDGTFGTTLATASFAPPSSSPAASMLPLLGVG